MNSKFEFTYKIYDFHLAMKKMRKKTQATHLLIDNLAQLMLGGYILNVYIRADEPKLL